MLIHEFPNSVGKKNRNIYKRVFFFLLSNAICNVLITVLKICLRDELSHSWSRKRSLVLVWQINAKTRDQNQGCEQEQDDSGQSCKRSKLYHRFYSSIFLIWKCRVYTISEKAFTDKNFHVNEKFNKNNIFISKTIFPKHFSKFSGFSVFSREILKMKKNYFCMINQSRQIFSH